MTEKTEQIKQDIRVKLHSRDKVIIVPSPILKKYNFDAGEKFIIQKKDNGFSITPITKFESNTSNHSLVRLRVDNRITIPTSIVEKEWIEQEFSIIEHPPEIIFIPQGKARTKQADYSKEYLQISVDLPENIAQKIDTLCVQKNISRSQFFNRAIEKKMKQDNIEP